MESLFEVENIAEMHRRIGALRAEMQPLWGKMTAAQMVAHCRVGAGMATDEFRPPRMLSGRLLGPVIKKVALKEGEPMRKNTPTVKGLLMGEGLDFEAERAGLQAVVDRFAAAGPAGCTKHPHAFFGKLTADEWSMLMWKHLDHHLRQFGV